MIFFFFSSRRRHTRSLCDWSSDVCSSDLEEVLSRMATTRNLIITVRGRQMSFFGHVMRNKEIESFNISGKIEGKRCRGRQIIIYTKSLSEWMKVEETEMIRASKD